MTYGTLDEYPPAESRLRDMAVRNAMRIGGLAAIALTAALVVSLATWNVDDPSFSYASDAPVRNLLGPAGAAFADLAMQFLGLAVVGLVCPLAVLGWKLFRLRPPGRPLRQVALWTGGLILLSAALGCLPILGGWPLPTGLGGAVGDIVLGLPEWFAGGELSGGLYAALAVVFGGLGLGLLGTACVGRPASAAARRGAAGSKRPSRAQDAGGRDRDSAAENRFSLLAGFIGHWGLAARAALRRRAKRSAAAPAGIGRPSARQEPRFRQGSAVPATQFDADGDDDDDRAEDFDGDADGPLPAGILSGYAEPPGSKPARQPPILRIPAAWRFGRKAADPAAGRGRASPGRHELDDAGGRGLHDASAPAGNPARAPLPPLKGGAGSARAPRPAQASRAKPGVFQLPPVSLLNPPPPRRRDVSLDQGALERNARLLEGVLEDFGVRGEIINVRPGPVVTLYELEPAPGIKSSRVISLADDIARSMSAVAARVAVIPGRNVIGIELPNAIRETVFLRELVASKDFDGSKAKLALSLGKTIGGEPVIADLAKMPHLLVAGTTGSGKSVAINTMILGLVYRLNPDQCRLIMIDPKMLELSVYDGIPHLLTPVVTDPKKAVVALKWTVREMEDRYKKMSKLGVRNIDGFNQRTAQAQKTGESLSRTVQTGFDQDTGEPVFETEELDLRPMPYIVVIIDEMADLMMVAGKEIEGAVQRLAQMARAAGIHVIMATQRPSVDVITGTIKANFPTRISFQVTSKIDSRTILGEQGAEQLLGQGDMLYMAGGGRIQRVHGPFVSDKEVEDIVVHLKGQGAPDYLDAITVEDDDEGGSGGVDGVAGMLEESADLYDQAVAVVLRDRKASTSYIQRRLAIGYNRAASLIEKMEKEGIVGAANHAGKREILVGEDAA